MKMLLYHIYYKFHYLIHNQVNMLMPKYYFNMLLLQNHKHYKCYLLLNIN